MLTVDLWDTVSRVADGLDPDGRDRSVLKQASFALRGQEQAIRFVEGDAAGGQPPHAVSGTEALVELVWRAATQLEQRHLLGEDPDPVTGLASLADVLDRISEGDVDAAKEYDGLVERLSRLAEQSTGDLEERVSV